VGPGRKQNRNSCSVDAAARVWLAIAQPDLPGHEVWISRPRWIGRYRSAETPEPDVAVLVTILYSIRRTSAPISLLRCRGCANAPPQWRYFWQLFHDSEDPTHFVEVFMDESWVISGSMSARASPTTKSSTVEAVHAQVTRSSHWLAERGS
jgi:hypothetical protein